jgi:phospholipid-binding lipoprotein MlaA
MSKVSGLRARRIAGVFCAALLLAGCAADGGNAPAREGEDLLSYEEPNDPLEVPNRFIFAFNDALDTFILKPIAVTYDFWLPEGVKDSVRNFVRNASSPVILANDVFQGEWERAEDTAARFFVNTVLSLGFFDFVDERHPYHDEDFGQTLAVYGADDGFYLVLPVLGPSSARDAVGRGVDILLDPLTYVEGARPLSVAISAAGAIDGRARNLELFREIKADSVDFYARSRSLYYQRRGAAIRNEDGPRRP